MIDTTFIFSSDAGDRFVAIGTVAEARAFRDGSAIAYRFVEAGAPVDSFDLVLADVLASVRV